MMEVLQVVFWISVVALLHSYILYPWIVRMAASGKRGNQLIYQSDLELPHVYILLSAFNEEAVLEEKVNSMLRSDYPIDKLHFYIGSDASTDRTNAILESYQKRFKNIHVFLFNDRQGKANILNRLHDEIERRRIAPEPSVYILTDANVMFTPMTVRELVKHFQNETIGQVGAHIVNKGITEAGISRQEKFYINRENRIKNNEGLAWGTMMGAFGACYAVRSELFTQLPSNYLMEDFYLSMHVLSKGYQAIHEIEAVCFEDLPNELSIEYTRKRRISAGNFQNLGTYYHLLWPLYRPLGFSFFSHKVLRWFGPLFIALAYCTSALLMRWNQIYLGLFIVQNVLLFVPVIDGLMRKVGVHSLLLRFISYFIHMNFALLEGFFVYLRGVKTNVWQPTKRTNE